MDWNQVTIYTSTAGIEPVTGRLYRMGIAGAEIEDERDFEEFLATNQPNWDYVDDTVREKMAGETRVKIYLPDTPEGRETRLQIRESMQALRRLDTNGEFGRLELADASLSEEDWANNWKQYFKPIRVGRRVLIRPEWEPAQPDPEGRVVFTVDPGMTFGTGAHETTRLCIEALERHVPAGGELLDLGSGSGILSVIGLLLGAQDALAVDIDPLAKEVALHNAALNGIGPERLTVLIGDLTADAVLRTRIGERRYPLILANIVADVILSLAPLVPGLLAEDGVFVCSGIITERREEVAQGLQGHGLRVLETFEEKGWAAMVCALA